MAKLALSTKRIQIDKANVTIVVATSVAAFITVFCVIGSKALLDQHAYQAKVIAKKEVAKKQLVANLKAVSSLEDSFKQFNSGATNMIGGSTTGTGDRDGDNAKIVLDALPSKYDFPALASSLEKLIGDNGNQIIAIQGTDDELNQQSNTSSASPQPVDMPFEINVSGSYPSVQNLVGMFEHSIRPFPVQSIVISGKDTLVTLDLKAKTYYQPEKNLQIKTQVVK